MVTRETRSFPEEGGRDRIPMYCIDDMRKIILWMVLSVWSLIALGAETNLEHLQGDLKFFTDTSCRKLKWSVRSQDLAGFQSELLRSVAAGMLNGSYDSRYRVAAYEAYPSPRELGKTLKLGEGFSRYENITGIYLGAGEHVVLVGKIAGKKISLLIPDWMRKPAEGIDPTKDPNGWGLHRQEVELHEGGECGHRQEGRQCVCQLL